MSRARLHAELLWTSLDTACKARLWLLIASRRFSSAQEASHRVGRLAATTRMLVLGPSAPWLRSLRSRVTRPFRRDHWPSDPRSRKASTLRLRPVNTLARSRCVRVNELIRARKTREAPPGGGATAARPPPAGPPAVRNLFDAAPSAH